MPQPSLEPMQTLASPKDGGCLDPAVLTCVLQRTPAGVIAHTVHTDTPVDTGVLHTIICVHSTGGSFETGGTGAPVVEGAEVDEEGQGKPGHWTESLVHMFGASTLDQKGNRLESNKPGSAFKESSGLQCWGETNRRQWSKEKYYQDGGGSKARRGQRAPNPS